MRSPNKWGIVAVAVISLLSAVVASSQSPTYRISAPYTYKNLTIFLLHGKDQSAKGNVITLQEAMERDLGVTSEARQ